MGTSQGHADAARDADAAEVCKAAEAVAELGPDLDASDLIASAGGDPTAFIRNMHRRHAVAWNRPADPYGTLYGFSRGADGAVADCQVALGVSDIPRGGPGCGGYIIWREPSFVTALYAGRSLAEIAAIVSMNALRQGARLVPWLAKELGPDAPADDRDFWVGWPGNEARLLRACRDLVSRRIGWRGGLGGGEPADW